MSLQSLIEANGSTIAFAASALTATFPDLESDLFVRVDQDRQPLPFEVAAALAGFLEIDRAGVFAEVARATRISGPDVRRARAPRLGDELKPVVYSPTVPVV